MAKKRAVKKTATRKKRSKRVTKKAATKAACKKVKSTSGQAVQVERMGSAVMVEYRKGGKVYRHAFNSGVTLYRTKCGNALLIAPVRAGAWIRG